jgi:hypothetical protein
MAAGHRGEGFAFVAAEQEDQLVQVLVQLGGAVAGVADEVLPGWAEVRWVAGERVADELQRP